MKTSFTFVMIDDDADDIELFKSALNEVSAAAQFFDFTGFDSAYHFLSNEMRPVPDFIFLDLNLPNARGLGHLKAIKDIPRVANSKIIIYTTSLFPKQMEEAKALNVYRCIEKPYTYQAICDLIRQIMDEISTDKSASANPGIEVGF